MVDVEGYFGGIINGLSRGDKSDPNLKSILMNTMVDAMTLIDMGVNKFKHREDSMWISSTLYFPEIHDTITKVTVKQSVLEQNRLDSAAKATNKIKIDRWYEKYYSK